MFRGSCEEGAIRVARGRKDGRDFGAVLGIETSRRFSTFRVPPPPTSLGANDDCGGVREGENFGEFSPIGRRFFIVPFFCLDAIGIDGSVRDFFEALLGGYLAQRGEFFFSEKNDGEDSDC